MPIKSVVRFLYYIYSTKAADLKTEKNTALQIQRSKSKEHQIQRENSHDVSAKASSPIKRRASSVTSSPKGGALQASAPGLTEKEEFFDGGKNPHKNIMQESQGDKVADYVSFLEFSYEYF